MIPSVEQLERWSVQRGDGLTTIPSSAWDGVMWFLRCMELMESDPDAQEAFKRAADQLGGRVTSTLAARTEQAEKERDDYREREPALDALLQAVTARVKTSRCLRRPDSKLESDPGDCGQCTVCRERDALARYRLWNERVRTCEQHTQDIACPVCGGSGRVWRTGKVVAVYPGGPFC